MNNINQLIDVIKYLRLLADSLQKLYEDNINDDEIADVTNTVSNSNINNAATITDNTTSSLDVKSDKISLEDVRMVLAEKSKAGFTDDVRAIINKHAANKLSDIEPSEYADVIREAEVIGNG